MRCNYILDFYCADAKLDVELDGFQHGLPEGIQGDEVREKFLADQDIETLRFWNHQWGQNREGCLLEIWNVIQRRTGCVRIMKNEAGQKFIPPKLDQIQFTDKTSPHPEIENERGGCTRSEALA